MMPGILGFYSHVEVTEIVAFRRCSERPINVLTLVVAEDRKNGHNSDAGFLNDKPIRISSAKDFSFGVYRYVRPLDALIDKLSNLQAVDAWDLSGNPVQIGTLGAQPPFFVPPDTYEEVPWNRVLKNNFWGGSYVFEWHDPSKRLLADILQHPTILQELTASIRSHVPISVASLSDRLGNVLVQVPSTALSIKMGPRQRNGGLEVQLAWHPKATPRPVSVEATRRYDKTIAGAARAADDQADVLLPIADGPGDYEATVWDDTNNLVLAATGPSTFISVIHVNMQMIDPEPRVFSAGREGAKTLRRIGVSVPSPIKVGEPITAEIGEWTQKRIYRDEIARLAARRSVVQYKPTATSIEAERQRALSDIRYLIASYDRGGVYLWDPYLDADDILETLFYSPTSGVDLRGMTAMQALANETKQLFSERQRSVFENCESNFRGLRLEFRGRVGQRGWDFHDRFVIFPDTDEGPLAWSLGASVKGLGAKHHILQKVSDGRLIADAFIELWDQLNEPENLIWKNPR